MDEENEQKTPKNSQENEPSPEQSPDDSPTPPSDRTDDSADPESEAQASVKSADVVPVGGRIVHQLIEEEMQKSYLDYAMSVIVGRALPSVQDGLKPVHRRILFAMHGLSMRFNQPYKKSARIVGEVLGKYHPHGDTSVYDALVRMAQDFSLRYMLIQGQGNFGCFTKDTQVALADGRNLRFDELIAEFKQGKQNYTYTVNDDGTISVAPIERPRLTRKDAELLKVILDNGQEIRCTHNHRFLLRNQTYVEAKDLRPGTSLMPLYTRLSTKDDLKPAQAGYTLVKQPLKDEWVAAHHLADKFNLSQKVYTRSAGRVRHHADFNKLNNSPENISRMNWSDHRALHSALTRDKHQNDPAYVKKLAQGRKEFWSNQENRDAYAKRLSERNKENWQDPVYAQKMRETLSRVNKEHMQNHPEKREEYSARATATLKRLWQDPAYRVQMRKNIIKGNKNHTTNKTGLKKFLKICNVVLDKEGTLNPVLYESYRGQVYPYGMAPKWDTGYAYYAQKDVLDLVNDACENHKVARIDFLDTREDVFDLTINGTHNFALAAGVFVHNSVDGDSPAAMRYTEARMSRVADEMLQDIEKNTVPFGENFDGSLEEPLVLPAKIPNLLINGSSGIAVGMATNIPPHNLRETIEAEIALIENPDIEVAELISHLQGPDFPTGGIILGRSGILEGYRSGRGRVRVKSVVAEEEYKGRARFIITEIPYQVNKAMLIEQMADCVKNKQIEGISDLRDESDRTGMRIVVELKKDATPEVVLNGLLKHTRLQTTFSMNMISLVDNAPKCMGVKEMLEHHLAHRQSVVRKRVEYDLQKAQERAHLLEGLKIALEHIDAAVELIKSAANPQAAKEGLQASYELSEVQAQAILDMKLQKLTGLEQEKLLTELKDLEEKILYYTRILSDEKEILALIKTELQEIADKFGDDRRTQIIDAEDEDIDIEDLIEPEEMVVTVSNQGYIKRMSVDLYRAQNRGGKGIKGASTKEEDFIEHLFVANTHDYMLIFTSKGKVYWKKVYQLPEGSRQAKGKPIVNLIPVEKDEFVRAVITTKDFPESEFLLFATRDGTVKKTSLSAYSRPRQGGIIAIKLNEGNDLVTVLKILPAQQILLASKLGQAVKFVESDVRDMGRNSAGVRGIKLKGEDSLIGAIKANDERSVLTMTENGYGKRTILADYRLINRGGSGVRNIICSERNGAVVDIKSVDGTEDIMLVSRGGTVIRTRTDQISQVGRNTQGVRLMNMGAGDKVVACAKIISEEEDVDVVAVEDE